MRQYFTNEHGSFYVEQIPTREIRPGVFVFARAGQYRLMKAYYQRLKRPRLRSDPQLPRWRRVGWFRSLEEARAKAR